VNGAPDADEPFEIFTQAGAPLGRARRADVHRLGHWHRSANVLLFAPDGRLYLQRRSATKDLWANAWDASVGEHLKPGEGYDEAAARGLREELGIEGVALEPLGGITAEAFESVALGYRDRELSQTFTGVYAGALAPNPAEVADVRLVDRATLVAELAAGNAVFTPWLPARLEKIGWL
jgi:isopentenyl-diphosphate Delta-isomerase